MVLDFNCGFEYKLVLDIVSKFEIILYSWFSIRPTYSTILITN